MKQFAQLRIRTLRERYEFTIDYQRVRKFEKFTQFFLIRSSGKENIELKLDIVNDIVVHYDGFEERRILGRIDSWRNPFDWKIIYDAHAHISTLPLPGSGKIHHAYSNKVCTLNC